MNFDLIPIWLIFATTILLVLAFVDMGFRLGHAMRLRSGEGEKESPVSVIVNSILGLSAFMLAFTFSIVAERYAERRLLVREEAIAIQTVWLRSDFLPEADRPEATKLLRDYLDLRLKFAEQSNMEARHVQELLLDTNRMQRRLWEMAVAHARQDMNSDVAALYIDSLNQMNGTHISRVAVGIQARISIEVWVVLYTISLLAMFSVGYQTGIAGSKRSLSWPTLALSFAMVFALIAALDRPDSGVLKVTQQPLIDLRESMATASDGT